MKSLEDLWGETYLATFPETKKQNIQGNRNTGGEMIFNLGQQPGKMTNIWRVFYAFIKRSAKFLKLGFHSHARFLIDPLIVI